MVAGAGNIGLAVSGYSAFRAMGFEVRALFDVAQAQPGVTKTHLPVYPASMLPDYLQNNAVDIGVIAVPETSAQGVCDTLVTGGVGAIWNFAPVDLVVPDTVKIKSVHLSDALLVLSYYMSSGPKGSGKET